MSDVLTQAASAAPDGPGRSGRTQLLAFITDQDNETELRLGLHATDAGELIVHRGTIRDAITAMKKQASPRVLLVDITGEEQPISALTALSDVVEPDVRVLVVGERQDVDLYRQLTRTLGVAEYLYKPLNAEVVAQHFGPHVTPNSVSALAVQGGRILVITGVCGGAGATTLAANLAWFLANEVRRHTVLLDCDLHTGAGAILLGAKTGTGLRLALETPARVDDLFIERIADPAGDRLAVTAAEEKLAEQPVIVPGAAHGLLEELRRRYNYVVADVPLMVNSWQAELLEMARQRVLVMQPTLPAVRDTLRAMALPTGAQQTRRSLVVLNGVGTPGTMTKREVETALQCPIDVAIPYLPRIVNPAATLGTPAVMSRGAFRSAIKDLARAVAAVGTSDGASGGIRRWFGRGSVQ